MLRVPVIHHENMTDKQRALAWASGAVAVLICTVVGVLLFKAGLDDADKWSSVIGMSMAVLIGIPATLYQVLLARRALTSGDSRPGVQITARGHRSVAGRNIGFASTGNAPSLIPGATSPIPRPSLEDRLVRQPVAAASDSSTQVRIEAGGERSVAAENIESVITGDSLPSPDGS